MRICVIGGGSWGTALAKILGEKGLLVTLFVRREELAFYINKRKENPDYLPGVILPPTLRAELELLSALDEAKAVVWTIPSGALRPFLENLSETELEALRRVRYHLLGIKGIDLETKKWPRKILQEWLPEGLITILGGPSFAKEVARGLPTAVVLAGERNPEGIEELKFLQKLLAHKYFRVYLNYDPAGVECAGALKNVIAIAGGICDGLELGANARASLITRGLLELIRVGEIFQAQRETFYGLAGVGDLVLTCTSALSRNYRIGYLLAKGHNLEEALKEIREVAEGVKTVKVVKEWAEEYPLNLPISLEVYRTLYEGISPQEALQRLLSRSLKEEF